MDNEERFKEYLLEGDFLNKSINWIAQKMSPEQVFNADQLDNWAKKNGWNILIDRNKEIDGMLKLMCDPENQPHQFMGDWEEAYDRMFLDNESELIVNKLIVNKCEDGTKIPDGGCYGCPEGNLCA